MILLILANAGRTENNWVLVECGSCSKSQWLFYTEVYYYCAICDGAPTPAGTAVKEIRYMGTVQSWIYMDAAAAYFACPIYC